MNQESKKMDILLSLKNKGYNLKDTEDPAVMSMDLGNGYTLLASITHEWLIELDDLGKKSTCRIDSVEVPFINAKDALTLYSEYKKECEAKLKGTVEKQTEPPKKKKNTGVKDKVSKKAPELPGMRLPIVYPSEMIGTFMRFKQWTANNNVIPEGSGVVVLNENEQSYRVSIPKAHISFDIKKDYVEVMQA